MAGEKNGVAGFQAEVDARKQHEVDTLVKGLKSDLAAKSHQYDQMLTAFESYKATNDFLSVIEDRFVEPLPIAPEQSSGESESLAAAFASDWHAFETVVPEQVSGLNEYTPAIAKASVETFFRTVVRWCEIHRAGTRIDKLLLGFLGDLITSMLHDDQKEMNAGPPLEEVLFVTSLVIQGIDHLLEFSGCSEIIICTCDGNHSRITEKKRKSQRAKHSLEWLMFQFIRKHYEMTGETRLTWNISPGYHLYVPIDFGGGKVLRLHHGDEGIRYQGGVGGLAVSAQRAIKQWNVARKADLDVFGHWHSSEYPRTYVAVGSTLGYSPLSVAYRTEFEAPQQAFVLFEKKHWVTAYHKIYVRQ